MHQVKIPLVRWIEMIHQLRERGDSCRESGAFLLASKETYDIIDILYYDDLEPGCLNKGGIVFTHVGYSRLWAYCKDKDLRVVADVHTHPGRWTKQSVTDKMHPMIVVPDHLALIVPFYAKFNNGDIKGVGAYQYLGSKQWKNYKGKKNIIQN